MWEQNVKGMVWCAPDQLLANPANARRHPAGQRDALREMIDRVGFAAPVIVNTVTGFVIDGHARIEEALTAGIETIPVVEVELTELQEKEFLAGFDATTLLATYDPKLLTDLVNDIPAFDAEALQNTLNSLARMYSAEGKANDPYEEYEGMPEFEDPPNSAIPDYKITVAFETAADLQTFSDLIGQPLTTKTKSCWYPPREPLRTKNVYYDDEG